MRLNKRSKKNLEEAKRLYPSEAQVGACWLGVTALVITIGLPIMKHFDNKGMAQKKHKQEQTNQDWHKHISIIEHNNSVSHLELTTIPTESTLYIGRATYIDEVGRRCIAPVIGDSSVHDLIPEPGESFPDIDIAFQKGVCARN